MPQVRSMSIVQVCVHDAVNGITGAHDIYLPTDSPPSDASPEAAAVAAAHTALVTLFSAQSVALDAASRGLWGSARPVSCGGRGARD